MKDKLREYEDKSAEIVETKLKEKERQMMRQFAEKERELQEDKLLLVTKLGEREREISVLHAAVVRPAACAVSLSPLLAPVLPLPSRRVHIDAHRLPCRRAPSPSALICAPSLTRSRRAISPPSSCCKQTLTAQTSAPRAT